MKKYRTLVLNANGRPLSIISWWRALYLMKEERVVELDFYADVKVKDGHNRYYTIPAVVIRKKMVNRKSKQAPFCKKNVYLRDALCCQYCGGRFLPRELTFDHVYPKSKWKKESREGTPTTWENVVTCCYACNRRKANKTCKEAGMYPLCTPVKPKYGEMFLGISPWRDDIPVEWHPYLTHLPLFRNSNDYGQQA